MSAVASSTCIPDFHPYRRTSAHSNRFDDREIARPGKR